MASSATVYQYATHRRPPSLEEVPDSIRVNPAGRWPWLQRQAFRLIRRLGGTHAIREVPRPPEIVRVDFDDICKAVCESRANMEAIYRREARYIVVGHDRYMDLMRAEGPGGMFAVQIPPSYNAGAHTNGRPQPKMFAGLKIVVCPWVKGLFLLPDLESD